MEKLSEDREYLVVENVKLVHYVLQNELGILSESQEYEDLVSIGQIGLIQAAINFEPAQGKKFSTFAVICIERILKTNLRNQTRKMRNDNGRTVSINAPIGEEDDDGLTREAQIGDRRINIEKMVEEKEVYINLVEFILNNLTGKKRLSILYRMGGLTVKEIGKKLDVSKQRITQYLQSIRSIIANVKSSGKEEKKIFTMEIIGNTYKISFTAQNSSQFYEQLVSHDMCLRAKCDASKVEIYVLAELESMSEIAQFIQTMEEKNEEVQT